MASSYEVLRTRVPQVVFWEGQTRTMETYDMVTNYDYGIYFTRKVVQRLCADALTGLEMAIEQTDLVLVKASRVRRPYRGQKRGTRATLTPAAASQLKSSPQTPPEGGQASAEAPT